jgi:hypothetical protein
MIVPLLMGMNSRAVSTNRTKAVRLMTDPAKTRMIDEAKIGLWVVGVRTTRSAAGSINSGGDRCFQMSYDIVHTAILPCTSVSVVAGLTLR